MKQWWWRVNYCGEGARQLLRCLEAMFRDRHTNAKPFRPLDSQTVNSNSGVCFCPYNTVKDSPSIYLKRSPHTKPRVSPPTHCVDTQPVTQPCFACCRTRHCYCATPSWPSSDPALFLRSRSVTAIVTEPNTLSTIPLNLRTTYYPNGPLLSLSLHNLDMQSSTSHTATIVFPLTPNHVASTSPPSQSASRTKNRSVRLRPSR